MLYTHVVAALVSAAIAATGAWQVQNWRYGEMIAVERTNQAFAVAKAEEVAREVERAMTTKLLEAQRAAQTREIALRRDIDAARRESDGLRDELAKSRTELSYASESSVRQRAAALTELFAQCSRTVEDLAAKADRHASDALMLLNAWPK
jgi:hypothetical protein